MSEEIKTLIEEATATAEASWVVNLTPEHDPGDCVVETDKPRDMIRRLAATLATLSAELAKARDEGFVQMSASDESDAWHAARIMDESYHVVYVAKRSAQDGDGDWCVLCSLRKLAAKGPTNG